MTIKSAILTVINTHTGVRDVELALDVMGILNPVTYNDNDYQDVLKLLVETNEIVQLDCIIPPMGEKKLYFPVGTKFQFHNKLMRSMS